MVFYFTLAWKPNPFWSQSRALKGIPLMTFLKWCRMMWIIVSVSASSGKTAMQIRQEQSVTLPRPDLQVIRTHSKTYPKRSTQPTGEPHLTHDSHPMRCESCYVCPIFLFFLKPPFIFRTPIKIFFMKSESSLTLRGFWMTWGWVINDRIFIFGWTNPLTLGTVNLSKTHK